MRRKQVILFISLLLMTPFVWAQEKLSLGLEDAKQHAIQFNKNILNSSLAVQKSQEQLRETISAGLPQVNATADYNNALGAEISIQFDESMPASSIPINPTSTFNLQVSQLIFSANYIVGVQTSKLYEQLMRTSQLKTEQEIVSQVVSTYYTVLIADESLKILHNNVDNLNDIYEKTKPMVQFGVMEKIELDQLTVQVNTLLNTLKSAERQLELSKNMLRYQLGVSADTELNLTDSLDVVLQRGALTNQMNNFFNIGENIDYQLKQAQGEIQKKQIDMQKANYLPTLAGYYSYTYKILKPRFDMQPKNMMGLQMNIPILSSGERRSKVRQANIDMDTYENEKQLLQDQLQLQYNQYVFNLRSAQENFENQSKNVEVSREVIKQYRQKFDHGMISSLELTTADNNYLKAESDYLQAAMQVLQAQNDLDKITGKMISNNQQ